MSKPTLYKQFKTDDNVEKNGLLLQYGETAEGKPVTIRIARAGGANTQFQKRLEALTRPHRRQLQTETLSPKVAESLVRRAYAETVVLGWENVEFPVLDAEGNPTDAVEALPFTVDNCMRLFTDLPDLFADLQEQASKAALFRQDLLEADAGN